MPQKYISNRIKVVDFSGARPGNWQQMPAKEGKEFIKTIESAFKKLNKLNTGRELIQAIDGTNKQVQIFKGDLANNTGSGMPDPQSLDSQIAATVVYFLPRHKVQTIKQIGVGRAFNPKLKASTKTALENIGAPTKKADTAPAFQRFITRARTKYADPVKMISALTGVSVSDINDMAAGTMAMDTDTFFKICYHFYDFLEPGAGVNAAVRFWGQPDIPDHILLGHELIHAWRMMVGKRLVMGGSMFDEEAMTVGLGPFAGWKFTENQLRSEAKLTRRMNYGTSAVDVSSAFVAKIQQTIEQGGGYK